MVSNDPHPSGVEHMNGATRVRLAQALLEHVTRLAAKNRVEHESPPAPTSKIGGPH